MTWDGLRLPVTLVGPGRAGRAFARALLAAGGSIETIVGRDRGSAELAASQLGAGRPAAIGDALAATPILVVAVPDDAIADVARGLAGRFVCRFAFHFAGALPADVLAPLRAGGAAVGSLHPLRPFTGSEGEDWRDTLVAVEGDAAAAEAGEGLARALGARPHRLAAPLKPLYHAAATLAAGGTTALLSLAVRAFVRAGLGETVSREALARLAAQAAAAVGRSPFTEAFTGPLERRDLRTIRAHREALRAMPEILAVYDALARETLDRTEGLGREEEIRALLEPAQRGTRW